MKERKKYEVFQFHFNLKNVFFNSKVKIEGMVEGLGMGEGQGQGKSVS